LIYTLLGNLNENAFISNIGGVKSDLINILGSQQSLKNINNKNGTEQKYNTNLNNNYNSKNKINKNDKEIQKNKKALSSNNEVKNENENERRENDTLSIEIMKNYKGVFSVNDTLESSYQTRESTDNGLNYSNNKGSKKSLKNSKSNSKESVFDKLLETIDNEEIKDNNIIYDSSNTNLENLNLNSNRNINGISGSINNNNDADLDHPIEGIKSEDMYNNDNNNNEYDQIETSDEDICEQDVIMDSVGRIFIPESNEDLINSYTNEKRLILSIKENINRMISNLKSRMSHNTSTVVDNSHSVISIIDSYEKRNMTNSQQDFLQDPEEIETYWSKFKKSVKEYKDGLKNSNKSLNESDTNENYSNDENSALFDELHKSFNELVANIQENNIEKLKDDFINKSITSIKVSCENLNPSLDKLDREITRESNNRKNSQDYYLSKENSKNSLNKDNQAYNSRKSSRNSLDHSSQNQNMVNNNNNFINNDSHIYSQEPLNNFINDNSQIYSQGNLNNFVKNDSHLYSQAGSNNCINNNPQMDNQINRNIWTESRGNSRNNMNKNSRDNNEKGSRNSLINGSYLKTISNSSSKDSILRKSNNDFRNNKIEMSTNTLNEVYQKYGEDDSRHSLQSRNSNSIVTSNYSNYVSNNTLNDVIKAYGKDSRNNLSEGSKLDSERISRISLNRNSKENTYNLSSDNLKLYTQNNSKNSLNDNLQINSRVISNNSIYDNQQIFTQGNSYTSFNNLKSNSRVNSKVSLNSNPQKYGHSNENFITDQPRQIPNQVESTDRLDSFLVGLKSFISDDNNSDNKKNHNVSQNIISNTGSDNSINNLDNQSSRKSLNNNEGKNNTTSNNQKEIQEPVSIEIMKNYVNENINGGVNSNSVFNVQEDDEVSKEFDSIMKEIMKNDKVQEQNHSNGSSMNLENNPSLSKIVISSMTSSNPCLHSDIYNSQLEHLDSLIKKSISDIIDGDTKENLVKTDSSNLLSNIQGVNDDFRNIGDTNENLVNTDSSSLLSNIQGVNDDFRNIGDTKENLVKTDSSNLLSNIQGVNDDFRNIGDTNENLVNTDSSNLLSNIQGVNEDFRNISETSINLVNNDSQLSFSNNTNKNMNNKTAMKSKIPVKSKHYQYQQNEAGISSLLGNDNKKPRFSQTIIDNENIPSKIPIYKNLSPEYILTPDYIYRNNNDYYYTGFKNNESSIYSGDDIINSNRDSNIINDSKLYNHRESLISNSSRNPRRKSKNLNNNNLLNNLPRLPRGACSLSTQEPPYPSNKKPIIFSKYYFKNRIHLIANENGMFYIKDEEYNLNGS